MAKELDKLTQGQTFKVGNKANNNYTEIDHNGEPRFRGKAMMFDDLTFNFVGRRLAITAGTVDMDWVLNCAKFQKNGTITNQNRRIQASETYRHEFLFSKDETDLIPTEWHFHWQQFNTTDKFEVELWYRITNNGIAYKDDYSDWTKLKVKTNDGHDVFPFALNGKDFMLQITSFPIQHIFAQISAEVEIFFTRIDSGVTSGNDFFCKRMDVHVPIDKIGTSEFHSDNNY